MPDTADTTTVGEGEALTPKTSRSRVLQSRRCGITTLGAVLLMALLWGAGCQSTQSSGDGPDQESLHGKFNADGPLSFGVENGGGASVDPPRDAVGEFSATFGGFVPCSKDGERATIDSVEVGSDGDRASVYLRRITPEAVKASAREDRGQFIPMAFGLGAPPRFDQPYAGDELAGTFEPDVVGQVVGTSCEDMDAAIVAVNNGQVPETGIEEFLIVVPAGPDGVELEGFIVTYSVDEETFREVVSWGMVVCDRARTLPYCSPRR